MDQVTALRLIEPLVLPVQEGLEIGTGHVQNYFPSHNKDINLVLAAGMTRYWLREHLKDKATLVEDCETEDIANNGVSVRIGGIHLKVWKDDGGDAPPAAGASHAKDAFLRQDHGSIQLRFEFSERVIHNLVLLWDVDEHYNLVGLRLASPKGELKASARPEWDWNVPVNPADVLGSLKPVIESQQLDIKFVPLNEDAEAEATKDDEKDGQG